METILLLDAAETSRQALTELLELAGYPVLLATDGRAGIEQALAERPSLVLCDLDLPGLDGYAVLQVFRQHPQLADIPFLLLGDQASWLQVRRGMELGADDYLLKLGEEGQLLRAVAARLRRFGPLLAHSALLNSPPQATRPGSTFLQLLVGRKGHPVPKGEYVYQEGNEPNRLYFVEEGYVKTVQSTPLGKDLITGFYGAGEFFGHKALLSRIAYYDSALTVQPSVLLYIPLEEFTQLLQDSPEFNQQLLQRLTDRLRDREQQLAEMAYSSLRRRVAATLVRLHEAHGTLTRLSRDELAAVVGTAAESVSRICSEFRQRNLISISAKSIQVLQPEQLRNINW